MKTLDLYLNEQLKNEEFRKEWEENQPEMDIIRAMADARISQNLTQKELAERTGINQADISKLENGKNYTLSVSATSAQTNKTVTLTGAVFEDGKTVAKSAQNLGTTATTYTVTITDAANFNVTIA